MAGNENSGRRAKTLTIKQINALFKGIDLTTSEDLRTFTTRGMRSMLAGSMTEAKFELFLKGVSALRALDLEARNDRRTRANMEGLEKLMAARKLGAGGAQRDVGPPEDDLEENTAPLKVPPGPDGLTH